MEEEEVDIADLMMTEQPDGTITIKQTPEQMMRATVIKRRIRKGKLLFPDLDIWKSPKYQYLDNLPLEEVEGFHGDMLLEAQGNVAPQLYTNAYFGASKLTETLAEKVGVDLSGLTEANMASPEINLCLKLIELEYGVEEQFGVEITPIRALLIATGQNVINVYRLNSQKNQQAASPQGRNQTIPQPVQSTQVQLPPGQGNSSVNSVEFQRAMELMNKMN